MNVRDFAPFVLCVIATISLAGAVDARSVSFAPDFDTYRNQLAGAFKAKDVDRVLDLLETEGRSYDNEEHARILVRYGLQNQALLIHRECMDVLSRMKDPDARQHVIETALESKRWEIRAHCTRIMSRFGGEFAYEKLLESLKDKKWQVRSAAIRSLVRYRRTQTIDALIPLLKNEKGRIKADITYTLRQLTGRTADAV
ncbi:MAG: HEAT repeat domain-containing protein, partial [Planctomycetota bacterium]